MRPRSQADHVYEPRAPRPPPEPVDPTDPVNLVDDTDEETVLDPAIEPDDEPTTIRPTPVPPSIGPRKPRLARGSSHGVRPQALGRISKYELRDKLGRGAFGVVFTARDPSLDRDVALKVLRPTHLTNQDIVQRFLQEARATARIAHPGIVTIHDCGRVETNLGATAFIAMELLIGESLTSRLARSGRLAPETAAEVARQVASALEAAHRVDVLHRDLKPDNIYVVPDPAMPSGERIKVLDFGLAKLGREGHTQLQTVFGTPRYMSPEQCRSATQLDHRSDIYSLGCILFELVTGRPPFDGDVRQLLDRHQRAIPPRARSLVPELSPAFDDLIAEMLAKDPMNRPQTMGAVQRALHHATGVRLSVAELLPVPIEPPPPPSPAPATPVPAVPATPAPAIAIEPPQPPPVAPPSPQPLLATPPPPRPRTATPAQSMFSEATMPPERCAPRPRSVPPEPAGLPNQPVATECSVPRPRSVPPKPAVPPHDATPAERHVPQPPYAPPDRPHHAAPPGFDTASGVVLVPARGSGTPGAGAPAASAALRRRARQHAINLGIAAALGLLIALLAVAL